MYETMQFNGSGYYLYKLVVVHCIVGKGVSSEGDEDSTTTWADWAAGRETEGVHTYALMHTFVHAHIH